MAKLMDVLSENPLRGESIDKYFVNREKELDYVLKVIGRWNGKIIGVFGSRGSGKTTFLNAVDRIYRRITGRDDILFLGIEELMETSPDELVKKNVSVLLIDDIAHLSDEEALKIYKKMYDIASRQIINVVYTDKVMRKRGSLSYRRWMDSGRELNMDLRESDVVNLFRERLRRGGAGDLFTEGGMKVLVKRAGTNLRMLFSYAADCYILVGKESGIKEDEVKDAVKEIDERITRNMVPLTREIYEIIYTKSGLNVKELALEIHNRSGEKISYERIYDSLRELAEYRFIITVRAGKERKLISVHHVLGIQLD